MNYLGLGTNLGDRLENLLNAISLLNKNDLEVVKVSSVYETAAWGFIAETSFYNCVVEIKTKKSAEKILDVTQQIEVELGRIAKTSEGYESRIIDIDLLLVDQKVINNPELVVPHEKIEERNFVLFPLCELNPLLIHPLSQKTIQQLKENSSDESEIEIVVTNIDFAKKIESYSASKKK